MDKEKVVAKLKVMYPGKNIIVDPQEIICRQTLKMA